MRFGGIERLYGQGSLARLDQAHVAVIGLGGVVSWAAEALARSGVGKITLIDLDAVCVTNVNRQIHALEDTVGLPKARAMADRLERINPDLEMHVEEAFFNKANAESILSRRIDYVIDAIDSIRDKCLLVDKCYRRQQPLVISGGAGGKRDPSLVCRSDLGQTTNDPLLKRLRRKLRQEYGFSRDLNKPFGMTAVYSEENPVFPWSNGSVCDRPEPDSSLKLDCASGFGTAGFLTGTLGFTAAAVVVEELVRAD